MPIKLVLGYDGSDCSKTALARTIDLARAMPGATVVIVYAFEFSIGYVPTGMTDSPLMMSAEFDDHAELVRSYGEEQVQSAATELTGAGVNVEQVVAEGRPVEALLETAKEYGASLIVVGSHGEGAVAAAFLGSTALKLLHHSKWPVLVVPRHEKG
jgi:nucleotide-binding universal stress UspA family protein